MFGKVNKIVYFWGVIKAVRTMFTGGFLIVGGDVLTERDGCSGIRALFFITSYLMLDDINLKKQR